MHRLQKTIHLMKFIRSHKFSILLVVLAGLSGCATVKPMGDELREKPNRKLVLVIERQPQPYNNPVLIQSTSIGIPVFDIFSGLMALSNEKRYNDLHHQLSSQIQSTKEGAARASLQHEFLSHFEARLKAEGIQFEVQEAEFASRMVGSASSRSALFAPVDHPLDPQDLSYQLRLDFGNCGFKETLPCIRHVWARLKREEKNPSNQVWVQSARVTPESSDYKEARASWPGYRPELPRSEGEVLAFDQTLRELIPKASQRLVQDILGKKEGEQ